MTAAPKHPHQHTPAKPVHIHPRHAKPYRKRHFGLLVISVVAGLVLLVLLLQYQADVDNAGNSASNFVANNLSNQQPAQQLVSSTYGFSLRYNPQQFYGTALDTTTGQLFIGPELSTSRAYQTVRVSPSWVQGKDNQSNLTLDYLYNASAADSSTSNISTLEQQAANQDLKPGGAAAVKTGSSSVMIDGQSFTKSEWQRQSKTSLNAQFTTDFVTYVGIINGKPLTIKINDGLSGKSAEAQFDPIIKSLVFGAQPTAFVQPTSAAVAQAKVSKTLLDSLLFTQLASADTQPVSDSERVSATYSPAVVKIYNVYCMDITLQGQPYIQDACDGVSGSGFFVSSDGYIATNGHVATATPKDLVIEDALNNLVNGDESEFDTLGTLAGLNQSDADGLNSTDPDTQNAALQTVIDKLYAIPDSTFGVTNNVTNLLVDLNEKEPDVNELLSLTNDRKSYPEQDSIKHAKLISWNYRAIDGITAFKASDVALLKISGSDFPVVKMGDISDLTQGSDLNILGFPSNASDNGIVDATQSKVTLTTGKVSSIKNATGGTQKLIETDTTIGHGNSGGPALDDSGNVVGIATYTADGSGQGDGVFNYVRDIQDFKNLVSSSKVTLNTVSKTQAEWEKGINLFYDSHYSASIKDFDVVKTLYPQQSQVDQFIADAQQRIKDGEDVKVFPVIPAIIGAVIALVGIGISVFLIIRHHGKHQLYKVASGQTMPAPSGFGNLPASTISIPQIPTPPSQVIQPSAPVAPAAPTAPAPPPTTVAPTPPAAPAPPAAGAASGPLFPRA